MLQNWFIFTAVQLFNFFFVTLVSALYRPFFTRDLIIDELSLRLREYRYARICHNDADVLIFFTCIYSYEYCDRVYRKIEILKRYDNNKYNVYAESHDDATSCAPKHCFVYVCIYTTFFRLGEKGAIWSSCWWPPFQINCYTREIANLAL